VPHVRASRLLDLLDFLELEQWHIDFYHLGPLDFTLQKLHHMAGIWLSPHKENQGAKLGK
jgi:hypothetical protein